MLVFGFCFRVYYCCCLGLVGWWLQTDLFACLCLQLFWVDVTCLIACVGCLGALLCLLVCRICV